MLLLRFWILTLVGLLLAAGLQAAQVTVFAAASLTETLKEIARVYEPQSGDKIVFNFAASGTLARQIEAGASADLFFSADETKADGLEKKGLLVSGNRKSLLGNTLVIVTPPDVTAIKVPTDLTNATLGRIAIGDPKVVPAGTYAQAYLDKLGLWTAVSSNTVPCESVRAVLAAVESGNVAAGLVYKTDAVISRKVKVVYEVPLADGPKITYPLALLHDAPQPEAAKKFMAYLATAPAAKIFRQAGFIMLQDSPATKSPAP